jgi:uncharacterized membrane protein YqaE (UPF0057 family)
VSFGYIGARHQRASWLAAAAVYFLLDIAALVLIVTVPNSGNGPGTDRAIVAVCLVIALWPAGLVHALWVNFATRLPLLASKKS